MWGFSLMIMITGIFKAYTPAGTLIPVILLSLLIRFHHMDIILVLLLVCLTYYISKVTLLNEDYCVQVLCIYI